MMVAAIVAALNHGRAAEFAAPDDERGLQKTALLQVLDKRGAGPVGVAAIGPQVSDEAAVLVPALVE